LHASRRSTRSAITVIASSVDVPLLESRAAEPLPAWAVPVFGKPTLLGVRTPGSVEGIRRVAAMRNCAGTARPARSPHS
jgi:hypothetical protein